MCYNRAQTSVPLHPPLSLSEPGSCAAFLRIIARYSKHKLPPDIKLLNLLLRLCLFDLDLSQLQTPETPDLKV